MISREEVKSTLIITFVVVELLSMIFNFSFIKITIDGHLVAFNFSVIFFCIGFFVVDIVSDFFSPKEASNFFYYKVYSQVLFIVLGNFAIHAYSLENTQISKMINDSLWVVMSGMIASYIGFKTTSSIMTKMKRGIYQGGSIFRRYLYSTLPGEILFSFIFSILTFSFDRKFSDVLGIFLTSSIAKFLLSTFFALAISLLFRCIRIDREERTDMKKTVCLANQIEPI